MGEQKAIVWLIKGSARDPCGVGWFRESSVVAHNLYLLNTHTPEYT